MAKQENPLSGLGLAACAMMEVLLSAMVQAGDGDAVRAIMIAAIGKVSKLKQSAAGRAAAAHLEKVAGQLATLDAKPASSGRH